MPSSPAPPRSAYVHVPFCRHRCGYCDFALVAGRDDLIDRYLAALDRELTRCAVPLELDTLYLGGGTPSHLGPAGLERLFAVLAGRLHAAAAAEVTVEATGVAAMGVAMGEAAMGEDMAAEAMVGVAT